MERFCEAIVWDSGKFSVKEDGTIWRESRRAEHRTPGGYKQVRVMIGGRRWYTCAHRLVWHALRGPIPHGMVINHKNGIKDDNRPDNLEMVTPSQNASHAMQSGLKDQRGEKNPGAKLTDRQVAEIRLIYSQGGYTQMELGRKYGVSFQTISDIVRGKRRKSQMGATGDYRHRRHSNPPGRDPVSGRFIRAADSNGSRTLDGRRWEEVP